MWESRRSTRILVIDDDPEITSLYKSFFQGYGFDVCTAENGAAGIGQVKECQPDIVIVDLNMPRVDGYEFIGLAKTIAPKMPIIVMSGVAVDEDAMKAARYGAWDFISKPVFDAKIVLQVLESCLEKAKRIKDIEDKAPSKPLPGHKLQPV